MWFARRLLTFQCLLILSLALALPACGTRIISLNPVLLGNSVPKLSTPGSLVVGRWGTSTSLAPPFRWSSVSGATHYSVAVGSTPGGNDISNWVNVGNVTRIALPGLILVDTQGYYLSVRAEDSAGNISAVATSPLWKVYTNSVFAPRVGYAVPPNGGNGTRAVALADVNGDGILDLLATGNNSQLSIFPGIGNGTFGPKTDRATGCPGQAISVSDLNLDGLPDVSVVCYGVASAVFPGTGGGAFAARMDYATAIQDTSGTSTDINGDGYPDLITAAYSTHSINIQTNKGLASPGTLNARTAITLTSDTTNNPAQPKSLVVADFNGDGNKDLLVSIESNIGAYGGSLIALLGNGNGTFGSEIVTPVPGGNALKEIAVGDFNGDGKLDVAVANFGANTVVVLLGNGDGTFTAQAPIATGLSPYGIGSVDLNGDGILDLVTVNSGANTVSIFLGNGDGTFQPGTPYTTGSTPFRVAIKDLNGDGFPDLAVSERGGDSVGILLMSH